MAGPLGNSKHFMVGAPGLGGAAGGAAGRQPSKDMAIPLGSLQRAHLAGRFQQKTHNSAAQRLDSLGDMYEDDQDMIHQSANSYKLGDRIAQGRLDISNQMVYSVQDESMSSANRRPPLGVASFGRVNQHRYHGNDVIQQRYHEGNGNQQRYHDKDISQQLHVYGDGFSATQSVPNGDNGGLQSSSSALTSSNQSAQISHRQTVQSGANHHIDDNEGNGGMQSSSSQLVLYSDGRDNGGIQSSSSTGLELNSDSRDNGGFPRSSPDFAIASYRHEGSATYHVRSPRSSEIQSIWMQNENGVSETVPNRQVNRFSLYQTTEVKTVRLRGEDVNLAWHDPEYQDVEHFTSDDIRRSRWVSEGTANYPDNSDTSSLNTIDSKTGRVKYPTPLPMIEPQSLPQPLSSVRQRNGVVEEEYHDHQHRTSFIKNHQQYPPGVRNPFKTTPPTITAQRSSSLSKKDSNRRKRNSKNYARIQDHKPSRRKQSFRQPRKAARDPRINAQKPSGREHSFRPSHTAARHPRVIAQEPSGREHGFRPSHTTARHPRMNGQEPASRQHGSQASAAVAEEVGIPVLPRRPAKARHSHNQGYPPMVMRNHMSPFPTYEGGPDESFAYRYPQRAEPQSPVSRGLYETFKLSNLRRIFQNQERATKRNTPLRLFRDVDRNAPVDVEEIDRMANTERRRYSKIALVFCGLTFVLLPLYATGCFDKLICKHTSGIVGCYSRESKRKALYLFVMEFVAILIIIIIGVVVAANARVLAT